jgi:hypothetical protein
MKKKLLTPLLFVVSLIVFAQDDSIQKPKIEGRFYGGVESNSQYYIDDSKLGDFERDNPF